MDANFRIAFFWVPGFLSGPSEATTPGRREGRNYPHGQGSDVFWSGYTTAAPLLSALYHEVPKEILFETMYLLLKTSLKLTHTYERSTHKHELLSLEWKFTALDKCWMKKNMYLKLAFWIICALQFWYPLLNFIIR